MKALNALVTDLSAITLHFALLVELSSQDVQIFRDVFYPITGSSQWPTDRLV